MFFIQVEKIHHISGSVALFYEFMGIFRFTFKKLQIVGTFGEGSSKMEKSFLG